MRPILSASQMRNCDSKTIEEYGIPSLVLMERAALAVCDVIFEKYPETKKVGIFCGPGNNGGDGVAVARILHNRGVAVKAIVLGDSKKYSPQLRQELEIANNYGVEIIYPWNIDVVNLRELNRQFSDCDLLVEALFGIGLTRAVEGDYRTACEYIADSKKTVLAVDIPTGWDTDSGKLLSEICVCADTTVTFAYPKKGMLLGHCKQAVGDMRVADVGIYCEDKDVAYLLDEEILKRVPPRPVTANKGICGKVLIVAGSESIYGACYLSAKAAIATGSGLVKIFTHENNIASIQQNLPEAMYVGYRDFDKAALEAAIEWSEVVIVGPGLGTSDVSMEIMKTVADKADCRVVIDADGLNLCAQDLSLLDKLSTNASVVITPHLKEMERLCGTPAIYINEDMENVATSFAREHNCTVVLKNYSEIICNVNTIYYCGSGNQALATPGSGDVLAGIIGSLLGQGMDAVDAAAAGAYIHGAAGTKASEEVGIKSLLASDIITKIHEFL